MNQNFPSESCVSLSERRHVFLSKRREWLLTRTGAACTLLLLLLSFKLLTAPQKKITGMSLHLRTGKGKQYGDGGGRVTEGRGGREGGVEGRGVTEV